MSDRKKYIIVYLFLCAILVIVLRIIIGPSDKYLLKEYGEYPTATEKIITDIDFNTYCDQGLDEFEISFDIKALRPGELNVYLSDGVNYYGKYSFYERIYVDTDYKNITIIVKSKKEKNEGNSYLSFVADWGTKCNPAVKNIKIKEIKSCNE